MIALVAVLFAVSLIALAFFPEFEVGSADRSSGIWSSILVIITLVITLLKQIIAFIGFLTTAIKILMVVAFVSVFLGVGILFFRAMKDNRKNPEKE